MAAEQVRNRANLRFAEEVRKRFSFLEPMGFRCLSSEPTVVHFESRETRISISHGRQSYEIDMELSSIASPTDAYSISEVIRLVDLSIGEHYRKFATHTAKGVAEGVAKLASILRRCIAAGVLTDLQVFDRLKCQREGLARNYALATQLEQIRRRSELSWHSKDYAAVVKILGPFREALTPLELKKLEFSEKKLRL
jgi:hypothetical protein